MSTITNNNNIQSAKLDLLHKFMGSLPDLKWDTSVSAEDAMCWTDEEKEQVVLVMCGPIAQVNFIYDFAKNLGCLDDTLEWDEEGDWTDNYLWEGDYEGYVPDGCLSTCVLISTGE